MFEHTYDIYESTVAALPRNVHLKVHKMLRLPRNLHFKVHKVQQEHLQRQHQDAKTQLSLQASSDF